MARFARTCSTAGPSARSTGDPEQSKSFKDLGARRLANLAEGPRGWCRHRSGPGAENLRQSQRARQDHRRNEHILTIEDPIEYSHQHKDVWWTRAGDAKHGLSEALRQRFRGSGHRSHRRVSDWKRRKRASHCRDRHVTLGRHTIRRRGRHRSDRRVPRITVADQHQLRWS